MSEWPQNLAALRVRSAIRELRRLASLVPPLWWTLPANVAVP
ncbi:hypothetical protein JQL36_29540 [Burkholderia diffusa]|nr:hypothetical protein [Burkholderia diffusa]